MTFGFSQSVADLVTRLTWAFTEHKTFKLGELQGVTFLANGFSRCVCQV